MSRATLLTVMGGVVLAATFATGIGWVAAQPGPNAGGAAAEAPAPAAANPKAEPPVPPAKPTQDPNVARKEADDKLKRLEQFGETLRREVDAMEKQIELLSRANSITGVATRPALLQKQHDEVETEFRQLNRELDKLEAEVTVLKKHLDEFPNNASISRRKAAAEIDIKIKKEVREKLRTERDAVKQQLDTSTGVSVIALAMRQSLEPQREMLSKINREIVCMRVQRAGVTFTEATETDTKLDAILRELAAMRKEVKELKELKK